MLRTFWKQTLGRLGHSPAVKPRRRLFLPVFEKLDDRILLAVTAALTSKGLLLVFGDPGANTITVSRDAAGNLLVNGGTVPVGGPAPTIANTTAIVAFGFNGDDRLAVDETNGPLPITQVFDGEGNDTVIGGSATDFLVA